MGRGIRCGKDNIFWSCKELVASVEFIACPDGTPNFFICYKPGSIVSRFLDLEKSGFMTWLMKFGGFKERLLADDLFLAKVGIECGVGLFTKVMAIIANFMLVCLPAPTVSLRSPLALNAGRLTKFFYSCPDNAFQVALSGTSFSLLQRIGAIVRNGAKLLAVGTTSSLVGTVVTDALINALKAVDAGEEAVENVPVLATSVAYGVYMSISSNLRSFPFFLTKCRGAIRGALSKLGRITWLTFLL